jgi:excisionase family DNA binding protein
VVTAGGSFFRAYGLPIGWLPHCKGKDATCDALLIPNMRGMITPRALTRKELAAYLGLSLTTLQNYTKHGKIPLPTLPGKRYDLKLIDQFLDGLSGLQNQQQTPLQRWKRGQNES